jgi:signal transduction histidine kinase
LPVDRLSEEEKALQVAALRAATSVVAARRRAEDERDRARADAEAAHADVEALNKVGATLASEFDLERIVQTVTDAGTSLTGAQFGAFAPTFHGTAIVRSDDITKDSRYGQMPPLHGLPPGHLPVRSYLAVPVGSRTGAVIGGLIFGHTDVGVFDERAERLASGIANWAAIAMDNARLYEAERKARDEAEHANKAKSEFLAAMSHELRTPLNAIGGYTDLLVGEIRGPINDVQRGDLERIKRNQHHLLSLINDILNFAKLEAGRVQFDPVDISINDTIGQLESLVSPQLEEKHLRYECHCSDQSLTAYTDPDRLQQILLNLLSNAIKFTPPRGMITVTCAPRGMRMEIQVTDTGVGIPPDKLETIFEPFVQLARGQTVGVVGTGLGLSISRDLARAMGAELSVVSKLDVGSTFTLSLPRGKNGSD